MIRESVEYELAFMGLKKQKARNIIAMVAVFLTTTLIISILTVGSSYKNIEKKGNLSQAPNADGGILGSQDVMDKITKYSNIEWASMLYTTSDDPIILQKNIGSSVELFVPDFSFYKNNDVKLISGSYPENEDDILISDTLASKLEIDRNDYPTLPISILIANESGTIEKDINMNICGYYSNPLAAISNFYEETYTSESFLDKYYPVDRVRNGKVYFKLKNVLSKNKNKELSSINSQAGGNGVIKKMDQPLSKTNIAVLSVIVILVIAGAYLMIFNIFNISLMNDIQYWGFLKTIGASEGQIRKVLNFQMWVISLPGIILGVICGNYLEKIITPIMLESFAENLAYVHNLIYTVLASVIGVGFSLITVKISCNKSFNTVVKISPIEAIRVQKKKGSSIFVVISLALSITVFLILFTVAKSQDADEKAMRYNTADFTIENRSHYALSNIPFKSLKEVMINKIKELPFVNRADVFYNAHISPDYVEIEKQKIYDTTGRVKNEGKIKEEYEEIDRVYGDIGENFFGSDRKMKIVSLPPESVINELKGKKITEGTFDRKEFSSNNFIIYQRAVTNLRDNAKISQNKLVHAGDVLEISFYDDARNKYITKKVTIMAIIENEKGNQYGASMIDINSLIMPNQLFESIYSKYNEMISAVKIYVNDKSNYAMEQEKIIQVLNDTGETTAKLKSVYNSTLSAKLEDNLIVLIGGFFAAFFGFLGIVNMINVFVTDIVTQEKEYTKMQAIGMTKKQLFLKLLYQIIGFELCGLTIGITAAYAIVNDMGNLSALTDINNHIFVYACTGTIFTLITFAAIISLFVVCFLNRNSIAERLRKA